MARRGSISAVLLALVALAVSVAVGPAGATGRSAARATAAGAGAGSGAGTGSGADTGSGAGTGVTGSTGANGACPASDPGTVVSQRPGAASALVPSGATGIAVCEFNFIGYPGAGARNALIGTGAITDAATVTQIAGELDALTEPTGYPIACPADAGQAYVAYFDYASGAEDPVRIQLGGCDQTTNGLITRLAIGSPVVNQITSVAQPVPAPAPIPKPLPLGPGPVVISVVAGKVQLCGGPAPGACHVENVTICQQPGGCIKDDRVRILRNGATDETVRLKKGRFSVVVSPGRYTVELLGDGRQGGKRVRGRVVQRKTVTTRKYATARVTFSIDVP